MPYTVELRPGAQRDFARLSSRAQARLNPHIDALAKQPRPPGCHKLRGAENLWPIRVGDYRILYQIHHEILLVVVITIGHRREIYR